MATPPDIVDVATLGIHPSNTPLQNSANAWQAQMSLPSGRGQRWFFATGDYHFAEPLKIVRRIWLEGPSGGWSAPQAMLSFPPGSDGLVLSVDLAAGHQSAGAKAINLLIRSQGKNGNVAHGIVMRCPIHLMDLYIEGFRGDGIRIHTRANVTNANQFHIQRVQVAHCGDTLEVKHLHFKQITPAPGFGGEFTITTTTDHNLQVGDRVWLHSPYWLHDSFPYVPGVLDGTAIGDPKVFHCGIFLVESLISATEFTAVFTEGAFNPGGEEEKFYSKNPTATGPYSIITGHGLFTHGDDSNAGNVIGCIFTDNEGWGILEHSFFGNTYIGCNSEVNRLGAYRSANPTSYSTFLGCYAERGQPPSVIRSPSVMIDGNHAPLIKRIYSDRSRFLSIEELEKLTFMGSRQTDFGFKDKRESRPTDNFNSNPTWEIGDRVHQFTPKPGGVEGYVCVKSGTFTNRRVLTQLTSDGTCIVHASCVEIDEHGNPHPTLCGYPDFGEWVEINGIQARVEQKALVGGETHFVMSQAIPASDNPPIKYSHPEFKSFGRIEP